ncbi:hypothetical protein D3C86_2214170 [compost metagenome]
MRVSESAAVLSADVAAADGDGVWLLLLEAVLAVPVEQALSTMVKHSSKVIKSDGLAVLNMYDAPSDLL